MQSQEELAAIAAVEAAETAVNDLRPDRKYQVKSPNHYIASNMVATGSLHPTAERWAKKFGDGFDAKTLTVTGDLLMDVPVGTFLKGEQPRYVADLVSRQDISGPVASWLRQTAWTNAAAAVARGAAKPESAITLVRESADLQYIATVLTGLHRADLEDESSLRDVIGRKLFEGIRLELDEQILLGTGVAPELQGIQDAGSGVATIAFATSMETTIRKARTALLADNVVPTALVMHPNDVEALDLKTVTGGSYLFQPEGPVDSNQDRIWGVSIVESPAQTADFAVLGDFAQAVRVFTNGGVKLDADPFTGFKTNTVDLRAEGRFAIGITAPHALRIVDVVTP